MSVEDLATSLEELLQAHGLEAERYDNWILPNGDLPAIRASWVPQENDETLGQLVVQVALDEQRTLQECYAGIGEGGEALRDGLENFLTSTFHVLLSALWGHPVPNQVIVEDWRLDSGVWRAHVGLPTFRQPEKHDVELPDGAFAAVERALKAEALAPGPHWLSLFYCNVGNGDTATEVLLDNELWPAGVDAYSQAAWPKLDAFYSARSFLFLVDGGGDQ